MKSTLKHESITILIAPLDWGLGHATRSIPIIRELENLGCKILLAGDGKVKALLEQEFPHLSFLPLDGYRIKYAKKTWMLPFYIFFQIPKILKTIHYENSWLDKTISEHSIDIVISDNRYGLYNNKIHSVFITHQLMIEAPRLIKKLIQKINYSYINKFSECWIPDTANENNLGGELSHPILSPDIPTKYIGTLSRFTTRSPRNENFILIVLSGPEPQRTELEQILIKELEKYKNPVVLVRGLPGDSQVITLGPHVDVYNHLSSEKLEEKFATASMIIGRSGYSTVMDIAAMNKKSILIPTPGQTEQEYLAKHLFKKKFAFTVKQKDFNLQKALDLAATFEYDQEFFVKKSSLPPFLEDFLGSLSQDSASE